jgi:hypothetical protein
MIAHGGGKECDGGEDEDMKWPALERRCLLVMHHIAKQCEEEKAAKQVSPHVERLVVPLHEREQARFQIVVGAIADEDEGAAHGRGHIRGGYVLSCRLDDDHAVRQLAPRAVRWGRQAIRCQPAARLRPKRKLSRRALGKGST